MKKIFTNLTFWVLTAITAGALLGHFEPAAAVKMKPLGEYFIAIIKIFIYPIILLTISLGISGMGDLKKVGRVGGKAVLYFEIVTTAALITGIIVAWLIQPGSGVNTSALQQGGDISKYKAGAAAFSWLKFIKENITVQILFFSIVFGIVLSKAAHKKGLTDALSFLSKYIFKALHIVMLFAPIGAFGGMAFTIGKYGIATLLPLGKLMLTVYSTCIIFIKSVSGNF